MATATLEKPTEVDTGFRFSILSGVLAKAVSTVLPATKGKTTLPVLSHVLVDVRSALMHGVDATTCLIRLTATNLEVGLSVDVPCQGVKVSGSFCLPGKLLSDLLGTLDDKDKVTLNRAAKASKVMVSQGRNALSMIGIDAKEFPPVPLPESDEAPTTTLTVTDLRRVIEWVGYAVAQDEGRATLSGIGLTGGSGLQAAASNGHRIAYYSFGADSDWLHKNGLILPRSAIPVLSGILPEENDAEIGIFQPSSRSQIIFRSGSVTLVSRLLEGQFPDLQRVKPTSSTLTVEVGRTVLLGLVRRALLIGRGNDSLIRLEFWRDDVGSWMRVTARASELGECDGQIPVGLTYADDAAIEPMKMACNGVYLSELLDSLACDTMTLGVSGPLSPALFTAKDAPGWWGVIAAMDPKER